MGDCFMQFGELVGNWRLARRRLGRVRAFAYLGVALALVLIAPFGTVGEPWLWRLAYWLVMIGFFDLVLLPRALAFVDRSNTLRSLPYPAGLVLMPLAVAVPMTLFVMLFDFAAAGIVGQLPQDFAALFGEEFAYPHLAATGLGTVEMYGQVLAICVIAGGLIFLCTGGFSAFAGSASAGERPGLRFLSRLPAGVGSEIRYLQMQDHYLRVVGHEGEALILISMRDAIAELEGIDGMQVHRSWWIAFDDLVQVTRDGRKTIVVMSDGTRIPVSETYRDALRERVGI